MSSEPVKRPTRSGYRNLLYVADEADECFDQCDRDIKTLEKRCERLNRTAGDLKDDVRILNNHLTAGAKTRAEQAVTITRLTEGLQNLRTALRSGCFYSEAIRDIDTTLKEKA